MIKMWFHPKWVTLIMDSVKTPKFSILLNGVPTGSIIPQRGLRRGDPLSSYLFMLCSEVLSSMITGDVSKKNIIGLRASKHCPDLHLPSYFRR